MGRSRKQRRQQHGSAWHWKQTDCWYYMPPGAKRRVRLFTEDGKPVRGRDNRAGADLALARLRAEGRLRLAVEPSRENEWLVADVCSKYIEYCQKGLRNGTLSAGHCDNAVRYLNVFCSFGGALPVSQLKRGHVRSWIESHETWALATRRNVIALILAAFNHAQAMHDVPNPLKPRSPRDSRPSVTGRSVGLGSGEVNPTSYSSGRPSLTLIPGNCVCRIGG
jgi:hypothetical protein